MESVPPRVATILKKYPDVAPGSLQFPADSETWTEKEIEVFIFSMGFIKPKRPPAASVNSAAKAPSAAEPPTPASVPSETEPGEAPSTDAKKESPATRQAEEAVVSKAEASREEAPATTSKPTPPMAEVSLMQISGNTTSVPLVTFMEDVGPAGLRLSAAALKCERSRTATLMRCAEYDLSVLKDRFGVGLLLREYAVEQKGPAPSGIMSVLWCGTTVELPCPPFMVLRQDLRVELDAPPVFSLLCVMLVLNLATMSPLEDASLYEKVAVPLREVLQLKKPTGQEGVPKFPRSYPKRAAPFKPTKLMKAQATVLPSDCDMYRVIFHPQMPDVCQRVNFALDVDFAEKPEVAFYSNMARPARVGDRFDVCVFIQDPTGAPATQHRVLYLFLKQGAAPGAADACVMSAFLVYGDAPGDLTSEDILACSVANMRKLAQFGMLNGQPSQTSEIDLTSCKR